MKYIVTLFLAAGIILGDATMGTANAVELNAGGQWQFEFGWMDDTIAKPNTSDRFRAQQRIRPEFRFVTDKNLSATLQLEIGTGQWGAGEFGMGADSNQSVKVRYGYVDWVVPGSDIKVRMGAQQMKITQYSAMGLILGNSDDTTGIAMAYQPLDKLTLNLLWTRAVNLTYGGENADGDKIGKTGLHDAVDVFALSGTWKNDSFKLTPYAVVAAIGTDACLANTKNNGSFVKHLGYGLLPANAKFTTTPRPDSDTAWWLGIGGELTLFDPFKIGLDLAYGSVDLGRDAATQMSLERKGWMVSTLASYKLDFMTPGLALWYGSGDDDNPLNGSERLPYIYQDVNKLSSYFFDTGFANCTAGRDLTGTWGAQVRFDNISFVTNLKHTLRAAYIKGTNDAGIVKTAGFKATNKEKSFMYLTDKDSAWVLNFDTSYQIYKNLTAEINLGYMKFDFDNNTWGKNKPKDDNMYIAAVTLAYRF